MSARLSLVLSLALLACRPALAQDAQAWIGAPDCRIAAVKPAPAGPPTWSGGCKDGYAEGKGVLEWHADKGSTYRLSATLHAGAVQGEGELRYPDGGEYTGSLKDGVPEGHGYYRNAKGDQFEGEVHAGHFSGPSEVLYRNGNDYKGALKDDRPDGLGTMTYMLGGRYEGSWRDGKRSGRGKLVYAGLPAREVATVDGHDPDKHYIAPDKTYTLKQDHAYTGTMLPPDAARAIPVPPALGYAQLTVEQQAVINSWYPALAPGDEPPYPLHGPAEFYRFVSTVVGKTRTRGELLVYVVVDTDGKVDSVRAVGLDDPEVSKVIGLGAAAIAYKPARCAGQPCKMAYGYNMALSAE
jgi:hypothetical protein